MAALPASGLSLVTLLITMHGIQQKRAYAVSPYPCIDHLRFLSLKLPQHPLFQTTIQRLQQAQSFLNLGCGFGQELRKLALIGAPMNKVVAVNLEPLLIDFGCELFLNKDRHAW